MDMFSKLKSAVSSALPGNPMSKEFEVYGQIATAGPGHVWKIYNGVKKTTKQDAAIFVCEKKPMEKYSRGDREAVIEALKKGVAQLTRLRHPKVLSVIQPLEESRESLAFATEPVFASLSNLLGNRDNLPEGVVKQLQEHTMFEMEIKYGLLQMVEGVQFLHSGVKLLHNNLCPESIIVNKNGAWKLAGFDFCVSNSNTSEQAPMFVYKDWEPDLISCAQPNLDYRAPEYALTESCSLACDMFAIGVLVYSVFNNGKPLYECKDQIGAFRKNAEELRKWRGSLLGKIPEGLRDIVKLLLNTEPTVRPDPDQLTKIPFFEDVGSMTLQYMDSLFQQDNLQKSKFFKGLPKIIVKFPKRVNLQRILPPLQKECVNPDMVPFVLPCILQIAEQATDQEYRSSILPELIPLFKITNPVQILLLFMQNMNLLLKKTPSSDIKTHVLPMIHRALESDTPQIQELCLSIIPTFADLIDYASLKNSIVPRVKKLCLGTSTIGVRVNCLLCMGKLLESMDKWFVLDEVLPMLPQIPSREPAVLMSLLGIYKVAFTHPKLGITKDILAGKVLPFLITISIDNNLNLAQFSAYISLVQEMVVRVETEHRSKLEQLEQMRQEQKNMEITKITESNDKTLIGQMDGDKPRTMMDDFMSGVGMSRMSVGGASKLATSSPSSTPASTPSSQPAKTLSLEEKQRLAREQEQQRFLKSAGKPLEARNSSRPSATQPARPITQAPKDLTSSLMQSNVSGLASSSANNRQMPNYSVSGSSAQPGFSSNSFNTGLSSGTPMSSFNSSMGASLSASSSSNFSQSNNPMSNQPNKKVDLSSFDSLLSNGNSQPKSNINQISQNRNSSGMHQGMMGSGQGMMGNMNSQGMMGSTNSQSMMGNFNSQGMMGNQQFPGQHGMMGQRMGGQTGMMNTGFSQNTMNTGFGTQPINAGFGMGFQGTGFPTQPLVGQGMGVLHPQSASNQNMKQGSSGSALDDLLG
ncbi:SCY1-like protein 2 isoform X2 [Mya arenaria]|uniref:SCY1-like protein 2 isoform X2 n=1 Tax=Mya arenaria TaxID=6604 RepID=UPI0022E21464|nr:SCY1-like protein 2 isoform X2 [Mya arenaria]